MAQGSIRGQLATIEIVRSIIHVPLGGKTMKKAFTALFVAGLTTVSLGSVLAAPSSADLLESIGIGAGVGIVTGTVVGDNAGVDDIVNGAAAGAAVEAVRGDRDSSLAQDAAVGAAASGVVGTITNDDSFIENAIQGGAAGALINVLGD
ncbi:hypothetical protein N836_09805 [Leptolyngbya sp. Heron Island J]|nr:hypothetical protein N836_09805 [Leptolyngbya sp. Heron Island J]